MNKKRSEEITVALEQLRDAFSQKFKSSNIGLEFEEKVTDIIAAIRKGKVLPSGEISLEYRRQLCEEKLSTYGTPIIFSNEVWLEMTKLRGVEGLTPTAIRLLGTHLSEKLGQPTQNERACVAPRNQSWNFAAQQLSAFLEHHPNARFKLKVTPPKKPGDSFFI